MGYEVYGVRENKCLTRLNGEIKNITVDTGGWTAVTFRGNSVYKKTISVPGIKEVYGPLYLSVDWFNSTGTIKDISKARDLIYNFYYSNDQIMLYAKKVPAVEFKIKISGTGLGGTS